MKKLLLCLCLFLAGCKVPLSSSYFYSTSRVGLYILDNKIERTAEAAGGVSTALMYAANVDNEKDRFTEALYSIASAVNPNDTLKKLYSEKLEEKGKTVVPIEPIWISQDKFQKFEIPKEKGGKKYYNVDLRSLKELYQIDELLIVNMHYGLRIHYTYGVDTRRYGEARLTSTLVNLEDNSIIYKNYGYVKHIIAGKWYTPPDFWKMKNGIKKSIKDVIKMVGILNVSDSKKKNK